MNRRHFLCAAAGPLSHVGILAAPRERLRRKDCFFGLHFDLHPNSADTVLGRDVTDDMVDRLLTRVRPDYVQYDCKGHVGYLGYPSKVSRPSPGVVKDSLDVWRRATARHGVALLIHFSGVQDALAVQEHPEWARVDAKGQTDSRQTSLFGPYVDERMIPQLLEASAKYQLDGVWVDGECWAVNPDYSEAAVRAFREATGIDAPPKEPSDKGWQEFLEFNREAFRKYVAHYCGVLHKARPGFEIASNWLYSTYVPEKPVLPVDYLSGDIWGDGVISSSARLKARYFAATGLPWDLLLWGFQRAPAGMRGRVDKPALQMKQESLPVITQGGGFGIYFSPTRAGRIDDRIVDALANVAEFCRARQEISHKTETVPQIGLLFSKNTLYRMSGRVFGGWARAVDPVSGLLDALVDSQYSVDILPDWQLDAVARSYPLIVVPDWADIGGEVKSMLSAHVEAGGKVLLAGAENCSMFGSELGITALRPASQQVAFLLGNESFGNAGGLWLDVQPTSGKLIESRFPTYDSTRDGHCAATLNQHGSGVIGGIYGPLGTVYSHTHAPALRQFLKRVVDRLFTPMVEVAGPPTVEVALRKKGGRLLIHLANCTAMQVGGDFSVTDFVPPLGPLKVRLRTPRKPSRVELAPEGRTLSGEWSDGVWSGVVDRLDLHAVIRVT